MKKAKIYIPSKTATQSGNGKDDKWILEFDTKDNSISRSESTNSPFLIAVMMFSDSMLFRKARSMADKP